MLAIKGVELAREWQKPRLKAQERTRGPVPDAMVVPPFRVSIYSNAVE